MDRAAVGGPAADGPSLERGTVARAATAPLTRLLEVTAVRPAEGQQRRQRATDPPLQAADLGVGQRTGGPGRIEPRAPEALVSQQVAEAGDPALVHQPGL